MLREFSVDLTPRGSLKQDDSQMGMGVVFPPGMRKLVVVLYWAPRRILFSVLDM